MSGVRNQRNTAWETMVLRLVDNPANEDRWGDANAIADRLRWPRRGMTATLDALERRGLVESQRPYRMARQWRVVR